MALLPNPYRTSALDDEYDAGRRRRRPAISAAPPTPKIGPAMPSMLPPPAFDEMRMQPVNADIDEAQEPTATRSRYADPLSQARYTDPINVARGEYAAGAERGAGDILKSALVGLSQGYAAGDGRSLAATLGGGLAGGVGAGIDPVKGRELVFDATKRPQMERDIARQQEQAAIAAKRQQEAVDQQRKQAEARKFDAEAQKALRPPDDKYTVGGPGDVVLKNGQPIVRVPDRPKQPTYNTKPVAGPGNKPTFAREEDIYNNPTGYQPYYQPHANTTIDLSGLYNNLSTAAAGALDQGDELGALNLQDQAGKTAVKIAGKTGTLPPPPPSAADTEQARIERFKKANPKAKNTERIGPGLGAAPDRVKAYAQRWKMSEEQARRELSRQ